MSKMGKEILKVGGPLNAEHAGVYIERDADWELSRALSKMDYVMVVEPRQQGKTSLVMHAIQGLQRTDQVFVFVDAIDLDNTTQAAWYTSLCDRMASQLGLVFPGIQLPGPVDSYQWRQYLSSLARFAAGAGKKVVIVLDEIGAIRFAGNDLFFSVLREVYSSRGVERDFNNLTFLLAGVFDPNELMKDTRVSPFNVAVPVYLDDFTLEQVSQLTRLRWPGDKEQLIARRIFDWAEGQPYLTQYLCLQLPDDARPDDVDAGVTQLIQKDFLHVPGLVKRLDGEKSILQYVLNILQGKRIKYAPTVDRRHRKLALLGIVKSDQDGYCKIRNRIYEQILELFISEPTDQLIDSVLKKHIDFVILAPLREEREAVLHHLLEYQKLPPSPDHIRTYYQAEIPVTFPGGNTSIYHVVVTSQLEMGREHAIAAAADAIRQWHPRYILLVGIAGGVAERGVKVGNVLIADQIADYEGQKLTGQGPQIRWDVQRADARLLEACKNFDDPQWHKHVKTKRPTPGKPALHFGPILSGDKVIADKDVLNKYRDTWSKLIGVEMEAAGVATAVFQTSEGQKPGFFMIRGVSDLADENKDQPDIEKWRAYACDVAATFAIEFLKSGPVRKK